MTSYDKNTDKKNTPPRLKRTGVLIIETIKESKKFERQIC